MQIFNELVNIITIIFLSYTVIRIKKKNTNTKGVNMLIYTMIAFIFLTVVDVVNAFFIKNPTLDISIVLLKLPLVIILVWFFFKLRKKGSL